MLLFVSFGPQNNSEPCFLYPEDILPDSQAWKLILSAVWHGFPAKDVCVQLPCGMGESSLVLYPSPYDRDPPLTASWSFMISSPITKHDQSFRGSQRSSLILPIKKHPQWPNGLLHTCPDRGRARRCWQHSQAPDLRSIWEKLGTQKEWGFNQLTTGYVNRKSAKLMILSTKDGNQNHQEIGMLPIHQDVA